MAATRRAWPAGPFVLSIALGAAAGIGGYTFRYAEGFSYFKTDPRACVNCHIMQPQYDAWSKSSHHAVAVCVDCHLPESFIPKYIAKTENGWRHGKLFTTQTFEEPIRVKPAGRQILQDNCVRCHQRLVDSMVSVDSSQAPDCVHCHFSVGHGERSGMGGPMHAQEIEGWNEERKPHD
jgi:cytochrome c nitrite reductase small subunit